MTLSSESPASNDIPDLPCPVPLSAVPAVAAFSHPENRFPQSSCPTSVLYFSGAATSDLPNNISEIFSSPRMTMSSSIPFSGASNPFPVYQEASVAYPMSMSSLQRTMMRQRSSWSMQPPSRVNVLPTVPRAQGPSSSVLRASFPAPLQTPLSIPQTPQSIHAQTHLAATAAVPIQSAQQAPPCMAAQAPLREDSPPPQLTPSLGHSPECVVTLQSETPLTRPMNCSSFPVMLEATNKPRGRPRGSVNRSKLAGDAAPKGEYSSKDKSQVKVRVAENSSKEGDLEESNAETSESRRADTPGGKRQTEDVRGVKRKPSDATDVGYETEKVVIEVKPGENIAHKIASFAERNSQRSVFVVSASGSIREAVISPVVLSHVQVIQGEHEILALSGAFVLTDNESKDRAGFLTVMLRQLSEKSSSENNPPQVAIAGVLKGSLIAASNVKINVMCIRGPMVWQENKSSKQKRVPESSLMGASSS